MNIKNVEEKKKRLKIQSKAASSDRYNGNTIKLFALLMFLLFLSETKRENQRMFFPLFIQCWKNIHRSINKNPSMKNTNFGCSFVRSLSIRNENLSLFSIRVQTTHFDYLEILHCRVHYCRYQQLNWCSCHQQRMKQKNTNEQTRRTGNSQTMVTPTDAIHHRECLADNTFSILFESVEW